MRMPTFGLAVWKEILDDAAADGAKELHAIAQWLVDQWTSENVAPAECVMMTSRSLLPSSMPAPCRAFYGRD